MPEFEGRMPEAVLAGQTPSESSGDLSSTEAAIAPLAVDLFPADGKWQTESSSRHSVEEADASLDETSGVGLPIEVASPPEDTAGLSLSHEVNQSLARLEMNSLQVKLYLDAIEEKINRMEPRLEQIRDGQQSSSDVLPAEPKVASETPSVPSPVESTTERRRRRLDIPPPTAEADASTPPDQFADDDLWSLKPWLLARRKQLAIAGAVFVAFVTILTFGVSNRPPAPATPALPANTPAPAPLGSSAIPKSSAGTPALPTGGTPSASAAASGTALNSGQPGANTSALGADPAASDQALLAADASTTSPADTLAGPSASRDPAATDVPSGSRSVPASGRVRVSSGVMAGNLLYSPTPRYPGGIAALFHMEGKVTMQAIIARNGHVENLRVLSGHRLLRGAAQDTVRTWRYRPFFVNGVPVEVATIVTVEFHR